MAFAKKLPLVRSFPPPPLLPFNPPLALPPQFVSANNTIMEMYDRIPSRRSTRQNVKPGLPPWDLLAHRRYGCAGDQVRRQVRLGLQELRRRCGGHHPRTGPFGSLGMMTSQLIMPDGEGHRQRACAWWVSLSFFALPPSLPVPMPIGLNIKLMQLPRTDTIMRH